MIKEKGIDKVRRSFKGVWIPREIWLNEKLSLQEKNFLAEINSLDGMTGCIASNEYFGMFFGVSTERARKVIGQLANKGFIKISLFKEAKNRDRRVINMMWGYGWKRPDGMVENDQTGMVGNDHHINKEIINKEIIKEENDAFSEKDRKELIDLFKGVNPNYEILFARKNQGEALKRMVLKFGREKVENSIKLLPQIINKPYAPRITSPIQLENKLGELAVFYNQEKLKVEKSKSKVGIIQ